MSCYQTMHGDYALPSREFVRVRKHLVGEYNKNLRTLYEIRRNAVRAARALKSPSQEELAKAVAQHIPVNDGFHEHLWALGLDWEGVETRQVEVGYGYSRRWETRLVAIKAPKSKLVMPKAEDYKPKPISGAEVALCAQALGMDASLTVTLTTKTRTLSIYIDENNRAVDRGEECALFRLVVETLKGVKWTRGTGGSCIYTDEYHRDELRCSGSAQGETRWEFGPVAEKAREARAKVIYALTKRGLY